MPFRFRHRGRTVKSPHPRRAHIHAPAYLGDHIADVVTRFSGSWTFLGLHAVWWVLWIFVLRVEAFPFGLLTMILSLEAIVLSSLVLMSQAREGRQNAVRDNVEAAEVEASLHLTQKIDGATGEIHQMQTTQMDILDRLNTLTEAVHRHVLNDTTNGASNDLARD